jgi:tetratricopeptide (TPR) repeat protein
LAPASIPADLTKGFDHFYNLEYDEALAVFRRSLQTDPNDPQRENHVAQCVLYQAMLKAGALESELVSGSNPFLRRERMNPTAAEQAQFDEAVQNAIRKAQTLLARNANDAGALYSMAVTHSLRANYNFLVRKAWVDSLKDATAARKFAQQALQADPTYIDAKLILGVHDYIVGSLSFTYKVLGFLAGVRGDREGGIRTMEEVSRRSTNNRTDAKVLLAAIYRREKKSLQAVPLLEGLIQAYPRNYLIRLELAQMFGDLGEREKALAVLDEVQALQRRQAPGFTRVSPEKLAYLKGNLLFWFDEYDRAASELRRAAEARERLDLNTALLACLRLGQTYDLMNRHKEAADAYQWGVRLAPESEVAKECLRHINRPYKRNRIV